MSSASEWKPYAVLGLLLCLAGSPVAAETRYVSDVLRIALRAKPDEKAKLIRTLSSGTALLLQGVQSGDFVKVTDPEGDTGWVLDRFLMDNPAAQTALPGIQAQLKACTGARDAARQGLEACEGSSGQQIHSLQARTRELEATLEESQRQIDELTSQRKEQADRELREWFVTGAAVLAGGVIMGLIISAFQKRRRPGAW